MDWIERLKNMPGRICLDGGVTVEILQWAYSASLPDNVPHRHTYYEVCLVGNHGSGYYFVESAPCAIEPGVLFVARPGIIHQIRNRGDIDMELMWVSFQVAAGGTGELRDLFRKFSEASDTLAGFEASARCRALWQALRCVAEAPPTLGQESQVTSLIASLLIAIAQAAAGDPAARPAADSPHSSRSALARIGVQYVHDNLDRPLPVAEIAQQLALSPRHLTRLFVEMTGVPPAAYIVHARMDRSRTLLLGTDDPIKQIAATSGYGDVHHFTRVFTRRFGCAPGRYRQTGGAAAKQLGGSDIQKPGALV